MRPTTTRRLGRSGPTKPSKRAHGNFDLNVLFQWQSSDIPLTRQQRARLQVLLSVASATVFIFPFKSAASDGRGAGAAFGLLFFSGLLFSPWAAARYRRTSPEVKAVSWSLSWRMALVAAFGNIAQGYAFEQLHAGVAATFIQMNVLFVAILGALWLKERLSGSIVLGVLLALSGVVLTQWPALSGHLAWSRGISWAIAAALGFSCMDLLSRRYSNGADAVMVNVARSWMGASLLALIPGSVEQFFAMSAIQIGACALAAVFGPGMTRLLLITASRDLPAAETALLQQLRPPLALPLTSLVFGLWPTGWEWAGSAFVAAGVALPLAIQELRTKKAQKR